MAAPKAHRFNRHQVNRTPKRTMADKVDIYQLYEKSVQCVESEIDFVDAVFTKLRNRKATLLREDFCGTANTSCEWVQRRATNSAFSVDLDSTVLDWSENNKLSQLSQQQRDRIQLINADVMAVKTRPIDMVLAMNFSYWLLEERATMIKYFRGVHASLIKDGIFFLDAFGGYEAFQEMEEETDNGNFIYVWDQHSYNPVDGHCVCHIHFKFKDGSKIRRAFSYEWRLWTLPELTEMLTEAGFKATVYWEGFDEETDDGDGIFEPTTKGSADAGWIAYIVAEKPPA